MPGPTTERLDDDFRSLRGDMQDIKVILAKIDAKLTTLDEDVRSNTSGLLALDARVVAVDLRLGTMDGRMGTMDARLSWLIGTGKWLGSIFGVAVLYGVLNIFSRLVVVENELKNVEVQISEMKTAIDRRPIVMSTELDDRINRIARAVVDDAIKRAALPKPSP